MLYLCYVKRILIFVLLFSYQFSIGSQLPTGFIEQLIAQNLDPTDMVITSDGRIFITIKSGKILIVENGVLSGSVLLNIPVDNFNERGLGHIVLDPNFDLNHYYYVYYTVPNSGTAFNRISRFTANGNSTLPGSEFVLMDLDVLAGSIHNGGDLAFGIDGKLYISVGESSNANIAQSFSSVLGKVLRINADGSIPADNPFYATTTGKNKAIFALGLRNPFSMDIQPGTGKIFVCDVGAGLWEEVNEIQAGKNYGWPVIEGLISQQTTPPANYKDPIYTYMHGAGPDQGCAVVGAAFYNPSTNVFPPQYVGKFYFADYCNGYIKYLDPLSPGSPQTFATGINRPVSIIVAPDGSLYYLARAGLGGGSEADNTSVTDGQLWKVSYTGSGTPFIAAQPQSITAVVGDVVNFIIAASGTQPLTYQWMIDGAPVVGGPNSPTFPFTITQLSDNGKVFSCQVSNTFGAVTTSNATLTVTSNTRPTPVLTITLSSGETLYQAGQTIQFSGSATDAEDGTIPISSLTWKIDFHHEVHVHPALASTSGTASGTYVIPKIGETDADVWYRVILTATDSQGLSKSVYQDVFPQKINIILTTSPANLTLLLDGQTVQAPITVESVIGITHSVEALITQTSGTGSFSYLTWTDQSLTRLFTFDAPLQDKGFSANYLIVPTGNGDGLLGEYRNTNDPTTTQNNGFSSAIALSRIDSKIDFDWLYGSPTSPSPLVNVDNFTVRWTGEVLPQFSEVYQFYTTTDDGVRLWVDDQLLIDKWIGQGATEWTGSIALIAGQRYKIKMEYFEWGGGALAKLKWSSARTPKQVIPKSQLFSVPITRRMVAIGSSTTAGLVGPSMLDSAWVSRFNYYYKNQLGIVDFTHNLGVGGYTMYKGMPSSYVNVIPPFDQPDIAKNVTKAVSLLKGLSIPSNGVVIVNFPSNGYDYMPVAEVINALQIIYDSATRAGNRCFIATTQPRTSGAFGTSAIKKKLAVIKDSIVQRFGVAHTINFWDGMYNPADTSILSIYSAGDDIHLNDAGHKVLFERVVAKNVFSLPAIGDYRSKVISTGSWNVASNWQIWNGLVWIAATSPPGSSDKVVTIIDDNRIDLTGDLTINENITISSTGILSAGSSNISLKGNWINNGGFLAGAGTMVFNGTTLQSISGSSKTDFNNINVTNIVGVQMQSNQNLNGVLTLGANAIFDADGSGNTSVFKLISKGDSPTRDAAIATLPSGAQVNGNVTIQRYMALEGTNARIYRNISSPVQNATVADLQNEIPITGSFTGSSTCGSCSTSKSMFFYDETVINDANGSGVADLNDGYISFPSANNTETLVSGLGYSIFVRGNLLSSALWDVRGSIKQGNVVPFSFPVTFTSSGNSLNDGWNLIGNPYPSTIDWNAVGWTKTNIDATIYFRDNGTTPGHWESWNGVVGTNGTTSYIAMGQGFWIKANAAVPVLAASENVKAPTQSTTFFRDSEPTDLARIVLSKGIIKDEAIIHFREDATSAFDSHADAWKLQNESFNLSSLSRGNEKFAINSWSALTCNTSISLSIDNMEQGNYQLKFSNLQSFEGDVSFSLTDGFLNTATILGNNQQYSFFITTDLKSKKSDRFILRVIKAAQPIVIEEHNGVLSITDSKDVQWYFNDQPIIGATSSTFSPDKSGTYSVTLSKNDCQLRGNYEFLVTSLEDTLPGGLSIHPNPTKDQFLVQVKDSHPVASASVTNMLGEILGVIEFQFSDGVSSGSFSLKNQASGLYFVKSIIGQKTVTVKVVKE